MNFAVLNDVNYPGVTFLTRMDGERPYLQVEAQVACSATGDVKTQRGRKWFLSPHMTRSEVVQTAFKAVMAWEEHEVREKFQYRGKAVFGPHFDVDALYALAVSGKEDVR